MGRFLIRRCVLRRRKGRMGGEGAMTYDFMMYDYDGEYDNDDILVLCARDLFVFLS